jgi:3-oxoacyl-[acyl-carrier-protein] synthase-1
LGRDSTSSAAAVRAGISAFTEHPYIVDDVGEPIRVALTPWLDVDLDGVERFRELLWPAIDESLRPLTSGAEQMPRVAIALSIPSQRPGLPPSLHESLRTGIEERYPRLFSHVATFQNGHASGLQALAAACQKVEQRAFDLCAVVGVDSYMEPATLAWLESSGRVHGSGRLNNAWGFIPGEGAGAVVVAHSDAVERLGLNTHGAVLRVASAVEPDGATRGTVSTGRALSIVVRQVLEVLPDARLLVDEVICDANGEPDRADEYGFMVARSSERFRDPGGFLAPADCWGDVGAASAPLFAMLALTIPIRESGLDTLTLLLASSHAGERGAALLRVPRSGN